MEVKAPTFPETSPHGELTNIHVRAGEFSREGEILFEIETDKAILEVEAPCSGKLIEYCATIGDGISSNQVIAIFDASDIPPINDPTPEPIEDQADEYLEPLQSTMGRAGILVKIGGWSFIAGALAGGLAVYFCLEVVRL